MILAFQSGSGVGVKESEDRGASRSNTYIPTVPRCVQGQLRSTRKIEETSGTECKSGWKEFTEVYSGWIRACINIIGA